MMMRIVSGEFYVLVVQSSAQTAWTAMLATATRRKLRLSMMDRLDVMMDSMTVRGSGWKIRITRARMINIVNDEGC